MKRHSWLSETTQLPWLAKFVGTGLSDTLLFSLRSHRTSSLVFTWRIAAVFSGVASGNSSWKGPGFITAPDRLCAPHTLPFSITATGTSPRDSSSSSSAASRCSRRVGHRTPGGAATNDRDADLDVFIFAGLRRGDEFSDGVDGRREFRRRVSVGGSHLP